MDKLGIMESREIRGKKRDYRITNVGGVVGGECFLIETDRSAFVCDTGFGFSGPKTVENLRKALGDRELDLILLTHSHYDHALGAPYIKDAYPDAKIVAGVYAAEVFPREGARKTMQAMDDAAASMYRAQPVPVREVHVDMAVAEGDAVDTDDMVFRVCEFPGHTRCSIGFYCEEEKLLLSCETLGVYGGGIGMIPIYLVGYNMAVDSLRKAMGLDVEVMLMPHTDVVQGPQVRTFAAEALKNTEETAREIMEMYRSGSDEKELIETVVRRYFTGYVRKLTPEAAFRLNAGYMIKCIIRDLS